jgi:hypothetical protein
MEKKKKERKLIKQKSFRSKGTTNENHNFDEHYLHIFFNYSTYMYISTFSGAPENP